MDSENSKHLDAFHKELGQLLAKYGMHGTAALTITSDLELFTSCLHTGNDPYMNIIVEAEKVLRRLMEAMTGEKSQKVSDGIIIPKKREN